MRAESCVQRIFKFLRTTGILPQNLYVICQDLENQNRRGDYMFRSHFIGSSNVLRKVFPHRVVRSASKENLFEITNDGNKVGNTDQLISYFQ